MLTFKYVSKYTAEAWGVAFVNERKFLDFGLKELTCSQPRQRRTSPSPDPRWTQAQERRVPQQDVKQG